MLPTKLFAVVALLPFALAWQRPYRRDIVVRDSCGNEYTTTETAAPTTTTAQPTTQSTSNPLTAQSTTTVAPVSSTVAPISSTTAATSTTKTTTTSSAPATSTVPAGFVKASGTKFTLDGEQYCFAGMNAYWVPQLVLESQYDATFALLASIGVRVLRTWAFSMVTAVPSYDMTYYQLWSGSNFTINEGANGLERLDLTVKYAEKYGIKLIMTLANQWSDFGGMEMYLSQTGGDTTYHSNFYTYQPAITAFESYINTIVTRYKSSTTVFAWEIANEPRKSGDKPADPNFTVAQLTQWISDRAAYIKSIDSNHMVAIGDEGFYNWSNNTNVAYDGYAGMDFEANLKLSNIDFGTFHLYPEAWGETPAEEWGLGYIQAHINSMNEIGKPVVLEEFNMNTYAEQLATLPSWIDLAISGGLSGWMPWGLGAEDLSVTGSSVWQGGGSDSMDLYASKSDIWSILKADGAIMNTKCPL